MEIKKFIGAALMAAAICTGFASCSNDDDKEGTQTLSTPKYEADAALFVIDSPTSPYGSVELTAAGNYIVTPSTMVNNAPSLKKGIIRSASRTIQIYEGKYTKNGDNTYELEGFGTITVNMEGDTAASLDFSLDNGQDFTLTAERQTQYPDSQMTNNLCRSWKITHFRLTIKVNGRQMFDKEVKIENLRSLYEALAKLDPDADADDFDEIDESELPEEVIFTKSGTYMVKYGDSSLAVSTWGWENQQKGILRYSWDYDHLYDPDASGVVTVSFPGNNSMKFKESYLEEDEDESYEQIGTWTFRQM